jgi:hypothetical protein
VRCNDRSFEQYLQSNAHLGGRLIGPDEMSEGAFQIMPHGREVGLHDPPLRRSAGSLLQPEGDEVANQIDRLLAEAYEAFRLPGLERWASFCEPLEACVVNESPAKTGHEQVQPNAPLSLKG